MKHCPAKILSLFLAIVLLLTGCGEQAEVIIPDSNLDAFDAGILESETADSAAEESSASSGSETFTMPYNSSYGWNPYKCRSLENRAILQLIYEGLFTMTPDFEAEPVLCESYEISETGLTYTCKLRDATFTNGQKLTADDVVFSLNKASTMDLYSARFRYINSYKAISSDTVEIYLKYANDRLPCLLDIPIVPANSTAGTYCGTGPFYRTSGTSLTRNENWWNDPDSLAFSSISLYESSSAATTRDAFESNQVQLVLNDPLSTSAATYHCDYELWTSGGTTLEFLAFNQSEGIFQDEAVRSAVLHAVDRDTIADQIYHNYADSAALPVSPRSNMYDEDLALNYSYDMSKAAELLKSSSSFTAVDTSALTSSAEGSSAEEGTDASADAADDTEDTEQSEDDEDDDTAADDAIAALTDDGTDDEDDEADAKKGPNYIVFAVCSGNSYREAAAELIAESLESLGFTVDLQLLEENEFFHVIPNDEWDLMLGEYTMTPDFDTYALVMPNGTRNYGHIPYDEELYSLYFDALENYGNRYDYFSCLLDHAYLCPVLFENYAVNATRGVFTNLNPAPGNLFYQIGKITSNE